MSEDYKLSFLAAVESDAKPCPLCGGPAQTNIWTYKGKNVERRSFCLNEKCSMSKRTYETGEWNTRPIEDALLARIKELEEK